MDKAPIFSYPSGVAVYERAKDYAVYDSRGVVIATVPRNPYVEQDIYKERARKIGNALT